MGLPCLRGIRAEEQTQYRDPFSNIEPTIFLSWEEKRNAYRLLAGNPEGKRPLGRPRRRWVGG
jgi:hypothetical protein